MQYQRIRNNSALEIMEQTLTKDDISFIDGERGSSFGRLKEIVIDDSTTEEGKKDVVKV